jgi:leucyl aminopeptidase
MIKVSFNKKIDKVDLEVRGVFSGNEKSLFHDFPSLKSFKAELGSTREVSVGEKRFLFLGLGKSKDLVSEKFRRSFAALIKIVLNDNIASLGVNADEMVWNNNLEEVNSICYEAIRLTEYRFDKYFSVKKEIKLKKIELRTELTPASLKKIQAHIEALTQSVNLTRDLVNEAPNILNSETYATLIEKDAKENLKGVKVKTLGRAQLKKEKMNLLLSVNAGSAFEPRLVHLTYVPKKATAKTKHIALVGKGITFDTGGYSLKPSSSIIGMKFDMGGSATVYGAFRSAVLQESPYKLTCVLAMTDNAVSSLATLPDAIIRGRNGTTVEILNTDAEGRLILADALDYTCDLKPDEIIDAATLTGACLVAFGKEVCAVLGNDDELIERLRASAKSVSEYMWQLPIIEEYRNAIKSKVADIKNIGTGRMAGTAIAAAFLEKFIKGNVKWAHLDVAGVCDSQEHLPYCPDSGASGLMVRTLSDYLLKK